jgi:hypothetical protein
VKTDSQTPDRLFGVSHVFLGNPPKVSVNNAVSIFRANSLNDLSISEATLMLFLNTLIHLLSVERMCAIKVWGKKIVHSQQLHNVHCLK